MTTYPDDLGLNQTRVLDSADRNFESVIYQRKKPPLSCEVNLTGRLASDHAQDAFKGLCPSGWSNTGSISDGASEAAALPGDVICSSSYADNTFKLIATNRGVACGTLNAWVNGSKLVIQGSSSNDENNVITLPAPPTSGSATYFVFLEMWRKLLTPTDTIYKYGNVLYGGTNPANDLIDPAINIETTLRIQTQYRIRIAEVDVANYPDGFTPNPGEVTFQGPLSAPLGGSYIFTQVPGDPGLWRAGTGDTAFQEQTGTVDGYTYAIPMFAIVQRNTSSYDPETATNGSSRSLADYLAGWASDRPDNKYNNWIVADDILDMRHRISAAEDTKEIVENAFYELTNGDLRCKITSSTIGEDHNGISLVQVDSVSTISLPWSDKIGTSDGKRRVFSNAAVAQKRTLERKTGTWLNGVSTSISTSGYPAGTTIPTVESVYATGTTEAGKIGPFPYPIVAVTSAGAGNGLVLTTTDDGITNSQLWNSFDTGIASSMVSVVVGKGLRVFGNGTNGVTTNDEVTWSAQTPPIKFNSVAWNVNLFVGVGDNAAIYTSPDGVNWTSRNSNIPNPSPNPYPSINCVIWGGNQFVAVTDDNVSFGGFSSYILTSPDGIVWTPNSSPVFGMISSSLKGLTWDGNLYVAVGFNGTIITSSNGTSWSDVSPGTSENFYSITWQGPGFFANKFVAVGTNGLVAASPSAAVNTWDGKVAVVSTTLNSVAWDGNRFIAVGNAGTIIISSDGNSWTDISGYSGTSEDILAITCGYINLTGLTSGTVTAEILSSNLGTNPITFDYTINFPASANGFTRLPNEVLEFRSEATDASSIAPIDADIRVRNAPPVVLASDQTRFTTLSNKGGNESELFNFGHQMNFHMAGNGTTQYIFDRNLFGYNIIGVAGLYDGTSYQAISKVSRTSTQYLVITNTAYALNADLTFILYTDNKFFQTSKQGRGIVDSFEMSEYIPTFVSSGIYTVDSTNKAILKLASNAMTNGVGYAYVDGTQAALTDNNIDYPDTATGSRATITFSSAPSVSSLIEVPVLTKSAIGVSEGYACFYSATPYQGMMTSSISGNIEIEGPALSTTAGSGAITNIVSGGTGTATFTAGSNGVTGTSTNWLSTAKVGYTINSSTYPDKKFVINSVVSDSSLSLSAPVPSGQTATGSYTITSIDRPNFNRSNIIDRLPALISDRDCSGYSEGVAEGAGFFIMTDVVPVLETSVVVRTQDIRGQQPVNITLGGNTNTNGRGRSTIHIKGADLGLGNLGLRYPKLSNTYLPNYLKTYQSYAVNKDSSGELYLMVAGTETNNTGTSRLFNEMSNSDSVDIFRMPGRPITLKRRVI